MTDPGKLICLVGSVLALLFPPYAIFGATHWGFLFGNIFSAFGRGLYVYDYIDTATLIMELILINGVGIAVFFLVRRRQKRKQRKRSAS